MDHQAQTAATANVNVLGSGRSLVAPRLDQLVWWGSALRAARRADLGASVA